MKQLKTILAVVVMIHLGGAALAQRDGAVQGVFMKLTERTVDDRACPALVVKPFTRDDHLTVLVPHEPKDLAQVVGRLRPGHRVGIEFVLDGGHRWLRGLDAQWRSQEEQGQQSQERIVVRTKRRGDPPEQEREHERIRVRMGEQEHSATERRENSAPRDRERESTRGLAQQLEQLGQQFRRLAAQVSRMERDMQALRAENERLRRMLGERQMRGTDQQRRDTRRPERDRQADADQRRPERRVPRERVLRDRPALPRLPDSLAGFQGVLTGKVLRKMDRGFVLKLERVTQVWEKNKADNPQAALGQHLIILIRSEQGQGAQFLRTLRALRVGQDVLVEAFHLGGEHLTVVEQLQALER